MRLSVSFRLVATLAGAWLAACQPTATAPTPEPGASPASSVAPEPEHTRGGPRPATPPASPAAALDGNARAAAVQSLRHRLDAAEVRVKSATARAGLTQNELQTGLMGQLQAVRDQLQTLSKTTDSRWAEVRERVELALRSLEARLPHGR